MEGHTKTFNQSGGCLGRSSDNDWMLPDIDRVVSSSHAKIEHKDCSFLLYDLSTNGTFINGSEHALGLNNPHALANGDIISAGDFQLSVAFEAGSSELASGLESVDFFDQSDKTQFNPAALEPDNNADDFDDWLSPKQAISSPSAEPKVDHRSVNVAEDSWGSNGATEDSALFQSPLSSDPFAEPQSIGSQTTPSPFDSNPSEGNDDWWMSEPDNADPLVQAIEVPDTQLNNSAENAWTTGQSIPAQHQAIQPQLATENTQSSLTQPGFNQFSPPPASIREDATHTPNPTTTAASVSNNSAIAQDLGLKSLSSDQLDQLSPELALIVKETLNRLIDLLRARSSIKNELRVDRTMIENHNNNPLKFSVAAEDALAVMFSAQAASFMPPHLAVADGFNDISDHQVAVMSGMKAAYEFMLEQFSPQRIQQRNTQKRGGILTRKEAQNWQSFEQYYQQLQQDKERTYNTIFGETFASAYEQQLADLKATRSITQHQNPRK
jgi:type VI secretion system FHA domain protein